MDQAPLVLVTKMKIDLDQALSKERSLTAVHQGRMRSDEDGLME